MGKKILIILIIIVALILVGIIGKNIYSALSVSVDELISQEKYEDAYKKAKTDFKNMYNFFDYIYIFGIC